VGIEKDVLRNLVKGPRTYDGLKKDFPRIDAAQILIDMEKRHLVVNKGGAWFITKEGKKRIQRKKQLAYNMLVIPAIIFFLLSAQFYIEYTDAENANLLLLQKKAEAEAQLSVANQQKEAAEAEYDAKMGELKDEQDKTAAANASYEEAENAVGALQEEFNYFDCLEKCSPDKFVTVDNEYVKAKVDEITTGLTTLRKKQEALYTFVRDEIEYDESVYHFGRLDFWEYPEDILRRGKGGFEDKFLLLLTMLRIAGTPPDDVRFVAAEVDGNDNWAWVEAYDGTTWWILDPFEEYEFTSTPLDKFYDEHKVVVLWWFNDKGFRRG